MDNSNGKDGPNPVVDKSLNDWDKQEIVYIKAKVFDLMRSLELLQFSMNKINEDKNKLLKKLEKLEKLEKSTAKPDKEGE